MLHIVGIVFKIIGILLAILLGIVLVLAFFLIVIPAHYHAEIKVDDEINGNFVVNSALCLLRFSANFKDGDYQYVLRFAGILVYRNKSKTEEEPKIKKRRKKQVAGGIFARIKHTISETWRNIKHACKKGLKLKNLLEKDVTREAFRDCKKEIICLLKLLKPKKIRGFVEFGTGDPSSTGQALGIISVFYFGFFREVRLYPNFEEKLIRGDVYTKGNLPFGKVFGCIFRLLRNRKIKYVMKKIKNLGGNTHVREK